MLQNIIYFIDYAVFLYKKIEIIL